MFGLSSGGKEALNKAVENLFDQIALQFIGDIPALKNKKRLVISSSPNYGLSHLFIQAMANQSPNSLEQGVLKGLLESSNGYIEALKNKTMSNVAERLDGLARESKLQHRKLAEEEIQAVLDDELGRAKRDLKTIAESESTKLRNLGTMMDISRVSASVGDEDPTVFFVVVKDVTTCKECLRLHLMDDGHTPRLWKLSQLKQGYHKRGEDNASAFGLHPHCRCTLTYLTRGFGFDKSGKLKYQEEGFDAYSEQD